MWRERRQTSYRGGVEGRKKGEREIGGRAGPKSKKQKVEGGRGGETANEERRESRKEKHGQNSSHRSDADNRKILTVWRGPLRSDGCNEYRKTILALSTLWHG